eukprot:177096-Rhodomonas_salina.1
MLEQSQLTACSQTLDTTTHHILHTTYYTLHTTHYTLHTTHYTLHTTRYTLNTTHHTTHTTHYTPHPHRASSAPASNQPSRSAFLRALTSCFLFLFRQTPADRVRAPHGVAWTVLRRVRQRPPHHAHRHSLPRADELPAPTARPARPRFRLLVPHVRSVAQCVAVA